MAAEELFDLPALWAAIDASAMPESARLMLFDRIAAELAKLDVNYAEAPDHRDFRPGDVRHSQADIDKAGCGLGYNPTHSVAEGLAVAMPWYRNQLQ